VNAHQELEEAKSPEEKKEAAAVKPEVKAEDLEKKK